MSKLCALRLPRSGDDEAHDCFRVARDARGFAIPASTRGPDRSCDFASIQLRRAQLCRVCRRHACFGSRCQWRTCGRPLVQISSPARHFYRRNRRTQRTGRASRRSTSRAEYARHYDRNVRRLSRYKPESLAVPRFRCDGGERLALAPLSGWLLLQDFHVAAGILGKGL